MKYYSQYRSHDLFELQESLSGLTSSRKSRFSFPSCSSLSASVLTMISSTCLPWCLQRWMEASQAFICLIKKKRKGKKLDKTRLIQIRCLKADFQTFLDFLGRHTSDLLSCFSRHDFKSREGLSVRGTGLKPRLEPPRGFTGQTTSRRN